MREDAVQRRCHVAAPAAVTRRVFSDVAQLPRDPDHDFWQIKEGRFRADLALLSLPSMYLHEERVDALARSRGVSPAGYFALGLPLDGGGRIRCNGLPVAEDRAVALGSRRELDCLADRGGFHRVVLEEGAMRALFWNEPEAPALADRWWRAAFFPIRAEGDDLRGLRALVRALLGSGCALPRVAADNVLRLVARILLAATSDAPRPGPGRPSERRRLALAAEEVMLREADRSLSIREVCLAIGASDRSLETSFLDHFGTTPGRYLRAVRLHRVHRDLVRAEPGTTVTHVAYRHGFWHLSRFAGYYRRMFLEPPSVTLARAMRATTLTPLPTDGQAP